MVVDAVASSPAGDGPGPFGSVVPFDATNADAIADHHTSDAPPAPPGHADGNALTCTVNVSVALKARPDEVGLHVNEVPLPVQLAPDETNDTPSVTILTTSTHPCCRKGRRSSP